MIKKYFTEKGVFIIGLILSIYLLPFTVGTILELNIPKDAGLATPFIKITHGIPLLFVITPILPVLLVKSFQGGKIYQLLLLIYILFFMALNMSYLY